MSAGHELSLPPMPAVAKTRGGQMVTGNWIWPEAESFHRYTRF